MHEKCYQLHVMNILDTLLQNYMYCIQVIIEKYIFHKPSIYSNNNKLDLSDRMYR